MHIVHVNVSKPQHRRLLNGHVVQLKHENLSGPVRLVLDTDVFKKYNRCLKNGKGCRISLSQQVMSENIEGEGFKEVLQSVTRGVKRAAKSQIGRDIIAAVAPHAANYAKKQVKKTAYYTEKQIESKLIKAGMPKGLVEEVITTGQTLTPMALDKIDQLAGRLQKQGLHNPDDYDVMVDSPVVGGRFSFKKLFKKIRKGFKKLGKALKPVGKALLPVVKKVARPMLKAAANAAITSAAAASGNPAMAPVLTQGANMGIDALGNQYGFGFRPLSPFRPVTRAGMKTIRSLGGSMHVSHAVRLAHARAMKQQKRIQASGLRPAGQY